MFLWECLLFICWGCFRLLTCGGGAFCLFLGFFKSNLQNDIKVLLRKMYKSIGRKMCPTSPRSRIKVVGCEFFSHLQEISIPSSTFQISLVYFSNLRLSGDFPSKEREGYKKVLCKGYIPRGKAF